MIIPSHMLEDVGPPTDYMLKMRKVIVFLVVLGSLCVVGRTMVGDVILVLWNHKVFCVAISLQNRVWFTGMMFPSFVRNGPHQLSDRPGRDPQKANICSGTTS